MIWAVIVISAWLLIVALILVFFAGAHVGEDE